MISVAMLSKWHVHAVDYAREVLNHPEINIKMVWDEIPERGQQWAEQLGVGFEGDLHKVLSNSSIDAVIVCTPTNMHKDVILLAAAHKKHIFSEKVLALTTEDCDKIFAAVEQNQVHLMLALKRLTHGYYLYAQELLDKGLIGRLNLVRCHLAHDGALPRKGKPHGTLPAHFFDLEQCGGGALIDLGAHPIYLTNRLAGPAKGVYARLGYMNGMEVDDNSVVLVEYESGALGVIEAGFVSAGSFLLEVHGTDGVIIVENGNVRVKSLHLNGNKWTEPEQLPADLPSPMEQWVKQIKEGIAASITKEDMWWLTKINQAAALSHREGRRVEI